jgi:hypothetical protein
MDSKPIGSGKPPKKGKEIGKKCKVIQINNFTELRTTNVLQLGNVNLFRV